ncbi:MAG: tetraacyldisaccharide 4'-kinase [Bacteroidetes bacterium]|nr:tetraacyldisaccharide 4'-kinase [Bacteroidota bacterium]
MNFRKLLFPFSIVYDGVTSLRNFAYEKGWKESKAYDLPILCVGNLSVGGTGKSPMVEYLIRLLKDDYKVAVLSRGYKRQTKGYKEVFFESTASEVGDEPLQFKQKFPEVTVAVCANRQEGIEQLRTVAEVIILDDAFQHRKVKPSFSIVLTPYEDLFLDDLVLPAGNLRESKRGMKRADVIIITKCPSNVSYASLQELQLRINLEPHQQLFFAKIGYDDQIYGKTETLPLTYLKDKPFTLVTGIANPKPFVSFLQFKDFNFTHKKFPDHHDFSTSEIADLQQEELILTTEKDYMRLHPGLDKFALYYLPIKTVMLYEQESIFNARVRQAVTGL